ncbi:ras-related protein Rab-39A [Pseudorasbora parva]|uniref:ras-related protein Rab-39A n=1 Tax=Pseudorasbora parva TaxID=51549 RepID=UPI00351DB4D3
MNLTDCRYHFKMIMVGDDSVGKSCMLPESTDVTIGMNCCDHVLEVEPGVKVNLQIWDTAGHEPFLAFTYIRQWHMEVCNIVQPHTVLFMLVGHKCDRKEREVNQYEVEEFASELGAPYIEASAKTGHNVAEAFELLTRRIYQGYLSGEMRLHESWGKIHKNKPEDSNKCGASKST